VTVGASTEAASPSAPATLAETWEDLLAAALVGTARRRPPRADALSLGTDREHSDRRSSPRPSPGEERQLPGAGGRGDPAAELLATAAVLAACRRAGRLPGQAPRELPAPAGPDVRPPCSDTAVEVLELILSGELPIPGGVALLAGQWLDGAARAGCRPPARLLPRLLELGASAAGLRPALVEVIGPRGRWLAAHDDRWAWATGQPIDSGEAAERRFATGPRAERPAGLEAVRRADPARGRDLLASTWPKEAAADRAAFLALLAVALSDDDEPFLEAALDDRSVGVRTVAADLLGRLPGSRRAARMADRLRPLVSSGGRQGTTPGGADAAGPDRRRLAGDRRRAGGGLTVARPPEPDAAARRDGVGGAAPAGMGASAWRVAQLVAGAPLAFWAEQLGQGPAEVVALAADGAPEVLAGLELAVAAQAGRADPAWAAAVFAHRPTPAVLAALPADRAAGELTALLSRGLAPRPAVAELFAACPGPWPESLADAVFDRYRQLGAQAALEVPAALPVLADRLDPSALPLVETWAVTLAGEQGLRRRVQTLGHALSLRAVIQREFPR